MNKKDEPRMQNIPIRTELGDEIRKAFLPKEGTAFIQADYSALEIRVFAQAAKIEEDVKKRFAEIICDQIGVGKENVKPEVEIVADKDQGNNIYFDELDIIEIGMAVEEEFDLDTMVDEQTEKLKTVKDWTDFITLQVAKRELR